jgi:hypothetical protein
MKITTRPFLVTEAAMRPASPKRRCFYCHVTIGGEHKDDCVLIHKKVMVSVTIRYDIEVPAHWSADDVEDHRNNSSWCANNLVAELDEVAGGDRCLCGKARFEFVRVASEPYLDEK